MRADRLPVAFKTDHQAGRELPVESGMAASNERRAAERMVLNVGIKNPTGRRLREIRIEIVRHTRKPDVAATLDPNPLVATRGMAGS